MRSNTHDLVLLCGLKQCWTTVFATQNKRLGVKLVQEQTNEITLSYKLQTSYKNIFIYNLIFMYLLSRKAKANS